MKINLNFVVLLPNSFKNLKRNIQSPDVQAWPNCGDMVGVKIEYGLNAKLRIVPVILSRGDNFICHFHGNLLGTIYFYAKNSYSFTKIYYFHYLNLQRTIQKEGNKH